MDGGLLLVSFCMWALSSNVLRQNYMYVQYGWAPYVQPAIPDNFSKRILLADADNRVSPRQDRGEILHISSWSAASYEKGELREASRFQAEGQWSPGHLECQAGRNIGPGQVQHRHHTIQPGYSAYSSTRGRKPTQKLWNKLMQLLGSKRIGTTAYHPSSEGLVERFLQQLKASLKAYTEPLHWSEKLPLVLLGIRSVLKEDLHCTATKLVHGTTLCLPGEFLNSTSHTDTPDQASYVAQLKVSMQQLWGSLVRKQPQRKTGKRGYSQHNACVCTSWCYL